jgi:hypothetical protein
MYMYVVEMYALKLDPSSSHAFESRCVTRAMNLLFAVDVRRRRASMVYRWRPRCDLKRDGDGGVER